jgi:hypothetical protein
MSNRACAKLARSVPQVMAARMKMKRARRKRIMGVDELRREERKVSRERALGRN